jgi:hypothetical protein
MEGGFSKALLVMMENVSEVVVKRRETHVFYST